MISNKGFTHVSCIPHLAAGDSTLHCSLDFRIYFQPRALDVVNSMSSFQKLLATNQK